MQQFERGTQAVIKTGNISHNLQQFRKLHPGKIMAVVKADAYGHGLATVVPHLKDCDAFAVATIDEALELRTINQQHRIILLEGVFNADELDTAISHQIDVVIHQPLQIELLKSSKQQQAIDVWLKIDTGMNRLGFHPDVVDQVLAQLESINAVNSISVMTHFASSNDRYSAQTQAQQEKNQWVKSLGYEYSFSNTGGVLNGLSDAGEWARVGIGLYGISPLDDQQGSRFNLKPVMQLYANIIASKEVKKSEGIGYGATYVAKQDMRIGIVGIGYADGYPWTDRPGHVMIDGVKASIVGRVSMDMLAIDLTAMQNIQAGHRVELWGENWSIEHVANEMGLIPYTLSCGITKRVKFEIYQ
ncbi:MAG: alanine racemase [Xanthomonadales bacterium]|nr:alanine racemase [Xanthomonadales bacterium]